MHNTEETTSVDQNRAKSLLHAAKTAAQNAYAPYSQFRVGAAARSLSGEIFLGCNIENVAFPLGICAEAVAIATARCAEGPALMIVEIAVYAEQGDGTHVPCTPCGGCRQRIQEFGNDIIVHFFDNNLKLTSKTAKELLPYVFTFASENKNEQ